MGAILKKMAISFKENALRVLIVLNLHSLLKTDHIFKNLAAAGSKVKQFHKKMLLYFIIIRKNYEKYNDNH